MSAEDAGAVFAYACIGFFAFAICFAIAGPALRHRRQREKRLQRENDTLRQQKANLEARVADLRLELFNAHHWRQPSNNHTRTIRLAPTQVLPQANGRPSSTGSDERPSN